MGLDDLYGDALGCQFGAEGSTPVLEEGFAAAVGSEERRWEHAAKGCHCEDETSFPLCHARCYQLCDAKCTSNIDRDNVLHFLRCGLKERDWDGVTESDIIDQDRDIEV